MVPLSREDHEAGYDMQIMRNNSKADTVLKVSKSTEKKGKQAEIYLRHNA